jgi:hypothetical protein
MVRPRTSKTNDEALTKRVAFRLTPSDYAAYKAKFADSGLTASEFFREAVLTNRTEIVARPVVPDDGRKILFGPVVSGDVRKILFVLAQAGNNLNQLAHRANADNAAGIIDSKTYLDILDSLLIIRKQLKEVTGAD